MAHKAIGEMGDVNPVEYGGGFIFEDENGAAEVDWFEGLDGDPTVAEADLEDIDPFHEPDEDDDEEYVARYGKLMSMRFPVYTVPLYGSGEEFLRSYDWINWAEVARSAGQSIKKYTPEKLSTVKARAAAAWDAAGHDGWHALDGDPAHITLGQLIKRWDLE